MYLVKNICADRDLGCFFDPLHHSSNPHTLHWEPWIHETQLKFEDEITVSDSYYDLVKPLLDEYESARILKITKVKNVNEEVTKAVENLSKAVSNLVELVEEVKAETKPEIEELEEVPVVEEKLEEPKEEKKPYNSKRKK